MRNDAAGKEVQDLERSNQSLLETMRKEKKAQKKMEKEVEEMVVKTKDLKRKTEAMNLKILQMESRKESLSFATASLRGRFKASRVCLSGCLSCPACLSVCLSFRVFLMSLTFFIMHHTSLPFFNNHPAVESETEKSLKTLQETVTEAVKKHKAQMQVRCGVPFLH